MSAWDRYCCVKDERNGRIYVVLKDTAKSCSAFLHVFATASSYNKAFELCKEARKG